MKIKFIFAWYDLWVGAFWDSKKRRLYVFPVPMFGFYAEFPLKETNRFFRHIGGFPTSSITEYVETHPIGRSTIHLRGGERRGTDFYKLEECLALVSGGKWEELSKRPNSPANPERG